MKKPLRALFAALLGSWLVLPSVGSEMLGGGDGGGTGIWILPRCASLVEPTVEPRVEFANVPLAQDLRLRVSSEMGVAAATFVDEYTSTPVQLPVSGSVVTCSNELLQALAAAAVTNAHIVISDANQMGYVVRLTIDGATAKVDVSVH